MKDPKPTYSHLVSYIRDTHPGFSYIHVVEPRQDWHVHLIDHRKDWIEKDSLDIGSTAGNNNDFIREIWGERPLISTGGYDRALALEVSEKTGNLIGFVRAFLGNVCLACSLWSRLADSIFSPIYLSDCSMESLSSKLTGRSTMFTVVRIRRGIRVIHSQRSL